MRVQIRRRFGLRHVVYLVLVLVGICLGAAAVLVLNGPSKMARIAGGAPMGPVVMVPASLAGVIDDRARFRQIFCALDADHGSQFATHRPCADALQRLGSEGAPNLPAVPLRSPQGSAPLHIVIIPGMFGECVKQWALPLQDGAAYIRRQGYHVDIVDVGGRSSSARNADIIARALQQLLRPGEHLVIIGYSKGMSDILETLVLHARAIPAGSAIVSLAGIVSGTPLADNPAKRDHALAEIPMSSCATGDAGAVESVSRRHRMSWLANHPLPQDRTYFSLVAYTDEDNISWPLRETYRKLAAVDPRNDGQVLETDAIVPGSHLLGYLNADHWAVALPLARNVPKLRPIFAGRNDFPREILLEAIVRSVEVQSGLSNPGRH